MGNPTFFMTKKSKWDGFTDILTAEYFTPDGPNGQTLLGFMDFCLVLAYSLVMLVRCVYIHNTPQCYLKVYYCIHTLLSTFHF